MGPIVWAMNFHYAYCLAGTTFQADSIGAFTYFRPMSHQIKGVKNEDLALICCVVRFRLVERSNLLV